MGQKINPIGFRLGINKTWDSRWYANTGEYGYITHGPTHLLDLIFQTKGVMKYFDFTTGVKNILNTNNYFMYPMSGGYPIGLGMGLEFFVQLKVNL